MLKPIFFISGYQMRLILPYQIPANLIPLDPKVCISHYDRIKNYLLNPNGEQPSEASVASTESAPSTSQPTKTQFVRRYKKKRFLMKSNHPRKSPRQHASTLAILSSLIHQRKKREKKLDKERDISHTPLGVIPEEEISAEDIKDIQVKAEEIAAQNLAAQQLVSELLSEPIELSDVPEEVDGIFLENKPDAIELLQNYNAIPSPKYHTPGLSETTRVIRRKRKKNRTGWPKKKKLFPRKEKNVLQEEDSRLTEGSDDTKSDNSDDRTIVTNQDSVDSNCNFNDSEYIKTESEVKEMLNDSSEDILNVYDLQGVKNELSELKRNVTEDESVNVDLNTWENAEKVLQSKVDNDNEKITNYQPIVRVQKLDSKINRQLRSSSSPERKQKVKKQKVVSPRSPRKLRAPRGKWYRER